jgi:hypothetical protein
MLVVNTDTSLDIITAHLVWATLGLALATGILALLQYLTLRLQRRELRIVEAQLALDRRQIEVTREQLRPRLELRDIRWVPPGQFPTAILEYVAGSEIVLDTCVWFKTQDNRRFAKVPNTPSLSRTSHEVTFDQLRPDLEERWADYFVTTDAALALTGDEWWAAVTWKAADEQRYCWMYVQRTDHVEQKEFKLSGELPEQRQTR